MALAGETIDAAGNLFVTEQTWTAPGFWAFQGIAGERNGTLYVTAQTAQGLHRIEVDGGKVSGPCEPSDAALGAVMAVEAIHPEAGIR
jgi:hypothetical protein